MSVGQEKLHRLERRNRAGGVSLGCWPERYCCHATRTLRNRIAQIRGLIVTVLFDAVAGEHRSCAARRQHLCRPAHRQGDGSDPRQRGVWNGTVRFFARTTADLSAFQSVVTIPLMVLSVQVARSL